jgi:hypothetical protein
MCYNLRVVIDKLRTARYDSIKVSFCVRYCLVCIYDAMMQAFTTFVSTKKRCFVTLFFISFTTH